MTLKEQLSRIKTLINLINESQSDCDFFIDKTNIVDYDDILQNIENRYRKTTDGKIVKMTMEQYLKYCSEIQDTTYEEQLSYIDYDNVNTIKRNMLNGKKYSLPYIDFDDKNQEGRHRVVAAAQLGCKLIDVAVFDKKEKSLEGDINLEDTNWSDVNQDDKGTYITINVKDNDITNELLRPYSINDIDNNLLYLTKGFINEPKNYYELNFDKKPVELIIFLTAAIRNGLSTLDNELIEEYDIINILNKKNISELLYLVHLLYNESKYYLKLHYYLIQLFSSVITYQTDMNNTNNFYKDINDNYEIEYKYPILKIYLKNKIDKNNYKNGISYLKNIGSIINDDNNYVDFYDFTNQGKELNVDLINRYLEEYSLT